MISLTRSRTRPIGLHLGPRAALLAQLTGGPGAWEVHALAQGPMPYDDDLAGERLDDETAAALRKLVADHHFRGRHVVSCLAAPDLFVQNVRLPQLPPAEMEQVVRQEAAERLPYPVAEAEVRHIPAGRARLEPGGRNEVILLACARAVVERHTRLLERAGLVPLAVDLESCAVLRSLHREAAADAVEQRRAYLNLGDKSSTVLFVEGGRMLFLKSIASGGWHLDLAVARHMGLSLAEAATIRTPVMAAPQLDDDDDLHRSVIEAIRHPLEAMAAEIELCLRYYQVTFRGRPLDDLCLTGGEASRWLAEFLAGRVGVPCTLGDPLDGLSRLPSSPAVLERPWRWTTALGLSMKPTEAA